jgi:hypothetical protein
VEIDLQRERLRLEALQLYAKYKPIERDLIAEADLYAREWGLKFGNDLCNALPRELRDLIYEYVIPSVTHTIETQWVDEDDPWGSWGFASSWTDKPDPLTHSRRIQTIKGAYNHLVSSEYYGIQMSQEMMQVMYKQCTFGMSVGDLGMFLTSDIFQNGYLPCESVRKLRIHITDVGLLDDWRYFPSSDGDSGDTTDALVESWPPEGSTIAHIDVLSLISHIPMCEITIVVRTGTSNILHPLLVNVGNIVFKLRKEGFSVRVEQERKGKKKKKRYTGLTYDYPGKDWTHIFDVSKEEWDERVRTHTLCVRSNLPPLHRSTSFCTGAGT